jgi:orotidine-5'-phosphate decarboxylase
MTFHDALKNMWRKNHSLLCVGLDPDLKRIPDHLRQRPRPLFEFCRAVVEATADLVCAYKVQAAFFAAFGREKDLEEVIAYIHGRYPGIPVILDAKRADIGSTAEFYAQEAFDRYQADAVTVNPYLGGEALAPFLERKDRGVIVLCRTSNPGAGEFQDLLCDGERLYRIVARKAAQEWNTHGNVLLVVGATYPKELGEIRSLVGDMPLLVPGIGAQGGDTRETVSRGKTADGTGLIINASRSVLYAATGKGFAEAARQAAMALREEINRYR